MADLIEEVDEDLRAERLRARLRRLLPVAAVVAAVAVAAVLVWQWRVATDANRARAASDAFFGAMQAQDDANTAAGGAAGDARGFEAVAADGRDPVGVRALASFAAAGIEGRAGNGAKATALLDGVAVDARAPRDLRQAAILLSTQRAIGTAPRAAVLARLKPLEVAGEPFRALALEDEAMADLAAGDRDAARGLLAEIVASDQVGRAQRERDSTLLQALPAGAAPLPGAAR